MTVCGSTKISEGWVLGSLRTTNLVSSQVVAVTEQLQSAGTVPKGDARNVRENRPACFAGPAQGPACCPSQMQPRLGKSLQTKRGWVSGCSRLI